MDKEKEKEVRLLQLVNLRQDSHVLEGPTSEKSPFYDQYLQATEFVCYSLRQFKEENINGRKPYFKDSDEPQNPTIIPFIGTRGTGKTSAMLSFLDALEHHDGQSNSIFDYESAVVSEEERRLAKQTTFLSLRYIDASILKEHEDILEIILSRMLNYLFDTIKQDEVLHQEELRQLYTLFEKTFRDLRYLRNSKEHPSTEETVSLRVLKELSSSHSVAREFRTLVREYLHFFSTKLRNSSFGYDNAFCLIVALDDIDLYSPKLGSSEKDTYTLLEQLYEFLMIPGVIVLMTYNEELLKASCLRHIRATFPGVAKEKRQIVLEQFLKKTLPTYRHIYMPALERVAVQDVRPLMIKLGDNNSSDSSINDHNESGIGFRLQQELYQAKSVDKVGIKQLLFHIFARRANVYFDVMGQKKHFMEARNLRELHDLLRTIDKLDDINQIPEDLSYEIIQRNQLQMLDYLYGAFASEKITGEEYDYFNYLSNYALPRRSRTLLDELRRRRKNITGEIENVDDGLRYSYGELLYNLYLATRTIQPGKDISIYSKNMIHCILGTYSFALSHLYMVSRMKVDAIPFEKNKKKKEQAYQDLKNVIGSSIAGRWANQMLPTFYFTDIDPVTEKPRRSNSRKELGSYMFNNVSEIWRVPFDESRICAELTKVFKSTSRRKKEVSFSALEGTEFSQLVSSFIFIGMFFTHLRDPFEREYLVLDNPYSNNDADHNYISPIRETSACFNVLNFCVNAFAWQDYFNMIHNALADCLYNTFCSSVLTTEESKKLFSKSAILQAVESCSPQNSYKEWAEEYGFLAVPIQHFDMTYNIIKRLADSNLNKMPAFASVSDILYYCKILYNNLQQLLQEQDEYYKDLQNPPRFAETYKNCPFIKDILAPNCPYDQVLGDFFTRVLNYSFIKT